MKGKNLTILSLLSLMLLFSCKDPSQSNNLLDDYNIIWDTQSINSSESMPVGGHSIGCNIWVENGDILFYAQRSGSFTENNEYHKLGRFRLKLTPNIFADTDSFRQELKLKEGYVQIEGEANGESVVVNLWVDALRPVIHLDIESSQDISSEVSYESWRSETKFLDTKINYGPAFGTFGLMCYPDSIFRHKDIIAHKEEGVLFYHRNPDNKLLIDHNVKQQGLENVKDRIVNTQKGRTFGGFMKGDGFVQSGVSEGRYVDADFKAWKIKSDRSRKKHTVKIFTHVDQTKTLDDWKLALQKQIADNVSDKKAKEETLEWWSDFWNRSWIKINPADRAKDSVAWEVARNYQLFRYQLGCNFYGEYPTKFNGGNFTFDPNLVFEKGNPKKNSFSPCGTPDWRAWGGGSFTAQNQRLLYWPMLKTGDFEGMLPQFDFYERALPAAVARADQYWGHEGACFTEQIENFGLPIACAWGWLEPNAVERRRGENTEKGVMVNTAIQYHYESQLEFSFMILEYYRYTGRDISKYMEFIKSSVKFFDKHYQMRHKNLTGKLLSDDGKLVIFPSTACESYDVVTNPTDVVAGLIACSQKLLELPDSYLSKSEKEYFTEFLNRIPDFTYGETKGDKVMQPGESWSGYPTGECPQLYPLFPFNLFEFGKDTADIEIFRNTWEHAPIAKDVVWSWHQDGIFYARMGLTEKAKAYNIRKMKDSDQRYPTFWGPGHDWVPDHNWGGSGMIGMQEMLMQANGDQIHLFSAWPKEWDVDFKLHAPHQTVVEGKLVNGELVDLKVTPEERRKDIVIHGFDKN